MLGSNIDISPPDLSTAFVLGLILVVAAALIVTGVVLIWGADPRDASDLGPAGAKKANTRRDIGMSLLTGSILTFAVFGLQLVLDAERKADEKRDQFRFSVDFAKDLSGLDPEFSLSGMYLGGKTLDKAALQGDDLSETNLHEASLKGTDLTDADLEGADLFGADLERAQISGANFEHADLRSAQLNVKAIDLPPVPKYFQGARVNSETCWPEDFIANVHLPSNRALRNALVREGTFVNGRTLVEASSKSSFGRACVLADENVYDDLTLYGSERSHDGVIAAGDSRQTVGQLAATFGRRKEDIVQRFEGGKPMGTLDPMAPTLDRGICAGSLRIAGNEGNLTTQGFAFLIVDEPGEPDEATRVIATPRGHPGQPYTTFFGRPLLVGTTVVLLAERHEGGARYRLDREVKAC